MQYLLATHLKLKEIDGELYIHDRANDMIHCCNRSATAILGYLQKNIALAKIPELIVERFDVGAEEAENDLKLFLKLLENSKLIVLKQEPTDMS